MPFSQDELERLFRRLRTSDRGVDGQLVSAALRGDVPAVQQAFEQGADMNALNAAFNRAYTGTRGSTLLHIVCYDPPRSCASQVVRELIRHGANLYAVNDDDKTPLDMATQFLTGVPYDRYGQDQYNYSYYNKKKQVATLLFMKLMAHHCEAVYERRGDHSLHELLRGITYEVPAPVTWESHKQERYNLRIASLGVVNAGQGFSLEIWIELFANVLQEHFISNHPEMIRVSEENSGFLPLHIVCSSSPKTERKHHYYKLHHQVHLGIVKWLIEMDAAALSVQSREGDLPVMLAASGSASLDVVYTLLRKDPSCCLFKNND